MRITFLTGSLGSGGSERVVSLLADYMVGEGHEVEIVCLKFNDVYYKTDERVGVVLAKEKCRGGLLRELAWLRRHLKKWHTDVAIAFTEGVYCLTICALLGTGIPVIASERNDPRFMSLPRKVLKRVLLPFADRLVVQTATMKSYFPKSIQRKAVVIFNPVSEDVFHLNAAEREDIIISVARLFPQKNQLMMIEAFAKIAGSFPSYQLVIYGEGPLRQELEAQVRRLGLEHRVLLPGRSDKVIEMMNRSRVFCLSSDYEGMSNAMLEAVCVGLPVVTTRVSGTDELVKDGQNGLVVPCGDVDALAHALSSLLGDAGKIERLGSASKAIAPQFRLSATARIWDTLIKEVKNSKK